MKAYILLRLGGLVIIILLLLLFFVPSKKKLKVSNFKHMLVIKSPVFKNNEFIPKRYTCDGDNINPPLIFNNVPKETQSLVLIADDPDAPMETWTHWIVWNIDPDIDEIAENSVPSGAVLGTNDFKKLEYGGPCPPSGTHRYFFRLYALNTKLDLGQGESREELEERMRGHIIDEGELMGRYSKQ